ncbi:MAG: GDSL-type esterase/lipase family protein [Muribaculaceae bacterium]
MNNKGALKGIIIIFVALAVLVALSFVPWNSLTDNVLKKYNLISDLLPQQEQFITHEELDPGLAALDSIVAEEDTIVEQHSVGNMVQASGVSVNIPEGEDIAPTNDEGVVLIEDYSEGGADLARIREGLANTSSRPYRIAIIGDSYIEGDIFSQDVRALLQDTYGGCGVGYMAAFSQFPGFRQSVRQSGDGWREVEIRHMRTNDYRILSGHYYVGSSGASALFKGSSRPDHVSTWETSSLLFIAPQGGTISISASDGYTEQHSVTASPAVQAVTVHRATSSFGFNSDIDSLIVLGTWLQSYTGVQLDCMSLRGNSGISHRILNADVISQMRQYIDYDLIILEFGINALTSEQSDYSSYAYVMTKVVGTIRACYPNSVIMIMGIGDRGQKQGTEVGSMCTAPAMVKAQRELARSTGALFWDTRAAMGGKDAVVDWHNRGLVNADYIHLNHKGGRELAKVFVNAINASVK